MAAGFQPPGLKLEQLTGADGPARSHSPLGLEWKYHFHINHACTNVDHSHQDYGSCLSLKDPIVLNAAPFVIFHFHLLSLRQ